MDKNKKTNYYLIYTLLFIFVLPLIYYAFITAKKSLIWDHDGLKQHYIALIYFGKWGREALKNLFLLHKPVFPLWDFHVGYGSDIITTFHYYVVGDPLNLFSILVPPQYTEYLYNILILLRIYLAGLSFSFYCFEMGKNKTAVLGGTFQYVFCGYILYAAVRHPYFANPMIYLPLLLTGAERILKKNKPTLFIFSIFLSAVSNFYFFYMLAISVCFYVVIRFFSFRHQNPSKELLAAVIQFACYALTGIAMSAVILLPVLLQFFQTNRIGIQQSYPAFYRPSYYVKMISSFLTAECLGDWTVLGFCSTALFAIFVLFGQRKKHLSLKISFLGMTAFLLIPFFGKALNGFSYVSNRWCFLYAALVSYILVTVWDDMVLLKNTSLKFVLIGCLAYSILTYLAQKTINRVRFLSLLLLPVVFLISLAASHLQKKKYAYRTASLCFLICLLLHAIANAGYLYLPEGKNYASQFIGTDTAMEQLKRSAPQSLKYFFEQEDGFHRYDSNDTFVSNSSAVIEENSPSFYWSLENSVIPSYLMDMSLNSFHVYNYKNLDSRTFLESLAGVKYFVQSGSGLVPYGYEYQNSISLAEQRSFQIYKNKNPLPLGYTYESYISMQDYQKMEDWQRQEALLQGIVLEETDSGNLKEFPEADLSLSAQSIPYQLSCGKHTRQNPDGTFIADQKKSKITLSFTGLKSCETYLSIQGFWAEANDPFDNEFNVKIASDDAANKMRHMTKTNRNYKNQQNYLINLGYHEKEQTKITITLPKKGTYKFQNLKIICQPMNNYIRQIEKLKENRLEEEVVDTNRITGKIRLSEDKILCLSIPYSKGFHALVDGETRELKRANVMYMALPLTKGEHRIELYYKTPGLNEGIWISILGFSAFTALCMLQRRPHRRSRLPRI